MATEARWEKAKGGRQAVGLLRKPAGLNERLLNALLSISGCATLEEALEPLLDAALDLTKMDGGGVYWVQGDVAVLRHHRGLPEAFIREVTRVSLTPPPVQTLLHLQEPVEIAELSSAMRELFHKHGIHHAFSFPLRARGILFGFLNVGSMRAEAPEKEDIQALWVLVRQVESLFFRLYSEKALRESEERQRRLLENLKRSHFIYRHDTQGVLQYVSESLTDIVGYTPAEFLGRYDKYMTDHPANQTVHRHTELSIQGIRQPAYEVNLWHKDGSSRWLEVQEVPVLDASGQVIAVEGVAQDITERKRAEEALRESERRLKRSQEIAHLGGWELDLVTNELTWSDEVYRIFGLRPQEFGATYEAFLERVHPDDRQTVDDAYTSSVREGRDTYEIEHRIVRQDTGEVRIVHEKCEHFRAADGQIVRSTGMVHDITERKRVEEALRESEQRYRTLWESALDGLVLYELLDWPRTGEFIDVNDCLCRMLGHSREEFLKLSPLDVVADDAKEAIQSLIVNIRQLGRMLFETTLLAKDGRRIPVEVNVSVVPFAERRFALAIVRDVTERKRAAEALRESEERFNAFMDHSPAIAWMKDEQGRYVYLSRTYERCFGVRFEDWRGKTDFEVWPRQTAEAFWKNDQEVLRTGRLIEAVEESPAPDGGRFYWWDFKFLFQDGTGRKFVGGIGVDIAERVRMEEMLRQANERLEEQVQGRTKELSLTIDRLQQAMEELKHRAGQLQKITLELSEAEERERTRLAQFLHDDLQQTLAAAKFHVSLLGSRLGGDVESLELQEQIKQMLKDAIEKSRNLSHELVPPVLHHGDLAAVFEWLAGRMEDRHGLTVQVEIRGHADSRSEPIRNFLYRAAQEMLFNTAKHAQVREARLRVQRVRGELWLTISDKGRGFDPAQLAGATGSGLLTIRERAELLGGRMRSKSAPGRGSTFFIAVPDSSD